MKRSDILKNVILEQNPTEQQKKAIFFEGFEYILRAAPGSGKTWTSCRRFIWRGANWPYPVGGLALLSFTNVAIKEFKNATAKMGRIELLSDPNYVGTFDSFVERYIISPFGHLINNSKKRPKLFSGPRPGDRANKDLSVWLNGKGNKKIPIPAWEIVPYPDDNKVRFKTSLLYGNKEIPSNGINPMQTLFSKGYYTHGQRVFWACKLLFKRPHIAKLLAYRFPEIIVDEAQDSNAWLLILLNFIRSKGSKITLIGDPDQCIYEFSMADATSLPNLKRKWSIPELPLSKSFRCNNSIAGAVCNIGGNPDFTGCADGTCGWDNAFVVEEKDKSFSDSISVFRKLIERLNIKMDSAAIVCRGHSQLESIRGRANYNTLKGKAKDLAVAAFMRDSHMAYSEAFKIVKGIIYELTGDDPIWEQIKEAQESSIEMFLNLTIWRFVKDRSRLISVSELGENWVETVRSQIKLLISELGLKCSVDLGHHITKKGLNKSKMNFPLFETKSDFPTIRQTTIHQVKGESIDAVLVVGAANFWNSVVKAVINKESTEDRRLAYVAMTRARNLLVVGLPQNHFNQHKSNWGGWGFEVTS
ncbi:MAG: ATP-dependent helicase [Tissierellales bacterium]|nr:ATP-dependent helicase [Tissierellales bacterium]